MIQASPGLRDLYRRALGDSGRFLRLLPAGREEVLEACLEFAGRTAAELWERYPDSPPAAGIERAIADAGVRIVELSERAPLLAEYVPEKAMIELYPYRVAETERLLAAANPDFFSRATLRDMCLAHEYLHHVEYARHGCLGGAAGVKRRYLGFIGKRRCLPEAGEVAAHEFVRQWFELSYSPIVFAGMVRDFQTSTERNTHAIQRSGS